MLQPLRGRMALYRIEQGRSDAKAAHAIPTILLRNRCKRDGCGQRLQASCKSDPSRIRLADRCVETYADPARDHISVC